MKHTFARAALALLVLLLLAPAFPVGALALSGTDPLLYANLSRADFEFSYVPSANSDYALFLFSADGEAVSAEACILENGEVIAEGSGSGEILSAWLAGGTQYTVRVHGTGSAVIEMARRALSRSYAQPLQLNEEEPYEKVIARAYDAHWYAFRAQEDGSLLVSCVPQDANLNLSGRIFDSEGRQLAEMDTLPGGAAGILLETRAGENYFLRACAPDGGEGGYRVNLNRPGPEFYDIAFDAAQLVVSDGSEADLAPILDGSAYFWASDAPEIAAVQPDGTLHALQAGEATISAYGVNCRAELKIRVEHVPLEGINILGQSLTLAAGDDADIQVEILPENASQPRLRYRVENPTIASVSRQGVLKALQPGETTLIVSGADGEAEDRIPVIVTPAVRRYRALLVGEENYPFAEDTVREGSDHSVSALRSLLGTVEFEDAAWSARTARDLSRSELLAAIRTGFNNATPQDVSLLYITCHGFYSGGMSFLELSDGSTLSARDLERELRKVSGTVVVLIDSCGSGGAIGAYSDRLAFAKGVTGAFAGAGIRGSKYKVIASAGLDQNSFRLAFSENAQAGVMATVFARALCDGAGWNIDLGTRGTMGADRNYDGAISLGELQVYMQARVNWYLQQASELAGADYRQSIQVYPEGDPLVLFERKP